jgi:hypothetical protein
MMQVQTNPTPASQFPICELEQLEAAINATETYLSTLQARKNVLTEELDNITRPQPALPAARKFIGPGFVFRETLHPQWSHIDI